MSRKWQFIVFCIVLFPAVWPVSAQTPTVPPAVEIPVDANPVLAADQENCAGYLSFFEGTIVNPDFNLYVCAFADQLRQWATNPEMVEKDYWVSFLTEKQPIAQQLQFRPDGWIDWDWKQDQGRQADLKVLLDHLFGLSTVSLEDAQYFNAVTEYLDGNQVKTSVVEEWYLGENFVVNLMQNRLTVSSYGMEGGFENGTLADRHTTFFCPGLDRLVPDMAQLIAHCSFVSYVWHGIEMVDTDPTTEVTLRWFANGWYNEMSAPWPKGQPLG
jgi:hypothetical protein